MNKVTLIGNVGQDPDVRYVDSNICVAQLRLATTERGRVMQDGTRTPDRTEWHNLVFWKGLAERVDRCVRKGMKLYIDGKLRTRSYVTRDNQTRYVTEVVVDNMEIIAVPQRDTDAATIQQQTNVVNQRGEDTAAADGEVAPF